VLVTKKYQKRNNLYNLESGKYCSYFLSIAVTNWLYKPLNLSLFYYLF